MKTEPFYFEQHLNPKYEVTKIKSGLYVMFFK